ncbi:MAG: DUF512 domain-containing protein [Actinobacteria bacterium]|nr:MAG: DUF512 domain-containing protein [Actinomycetota bacterium]RIK05551.1 MAG: DUF512 domain-containing protein [Acidobacteriota bacterium]
MSLPRVVAIEAGSPAETAGVLVGDQIVSINGQSPRDVIQYQLLVDEGPLTLELCRGRVELDLQIEKPAGAPLGVEVQSAVFDQVRTCDNHCEFCFIYQLPRGMRPSLYVKDDDYRLSFLYGNFTTLTRFTEADLERVVTERLSPLYVSIHATDPDVRAGMLRNRRGATSLRWLGALLDNGIEVHGQVVVCPGVNDGEVLDDTLSGVLDEYPALSSLGVVPLGVSRHSAEAGLREHTPAEVLRTVETVEEWQRVFTTVLGRPLVHAADEYYLLAGGRMPPAEAYGEFAQRENGIGMARAFEMEFCGARSGNRVRRGGFFAVIDGAPAAGYRAPRSQVTRAASTRGQSGGGRGSVTVLTGEYGAAVLDPLLDAHGLEAEVLAVPNEFFGGNVAVTGLLTGHDIGTAIRSRPAGRYLLPDVCLSKGRFLDGSTPGELPHPVEVIPTDGSSLRRALGG